MGDAGIDDTMLRRQIALIDSMTKKERRNPELLQASRKKRIAAGAGLEVQELNRLLKMHRQMADAMKKLGGMGKKGLLRGGLGALFGKGGGMLLGRAGNAADAGRDAAGAPRLGRRPAPGHDLALRALRPREEEMSGPAKNSEAAGFGKLARSETIRRAADLLHGHREFNRPARRDPRVHARRAVQAHPVRRRPQGAARPAPLDRRASSIQIARLERLAEEADLDPAFARKFLNFIISEVIRHHERHLENNTQGD